MDTWGVEIIEARNVPLGGLRAMNVRRTLPSRERTTIGAWCFVDHYGPDDVAGTDGMVVSAHPHTGLQTVSWLFEGEIEHRDSAGHRAFVRPGEVNLMTAGRGISHTEISVPETTVLHGVQLWVVLPDGDRFVDPGFEHAVAPVVESTGTRSRVFVGEALGVASPMTTYTPLLAIEVTLDDGATWTMPADPTFEYGVLVDVGSALVEGLPIPPSSVGYLPPGQDNLTVTADGPTRIVVLGGLPFGEQIVMWWNFIGRTHEEVVAFREEWQGLLVGRDQDRFSFPDDDRYPPIPAPELPHNVRMRSR